jgi:hypothetical protein
MNRALTLALEKRRSQLIYRLDRSFRRTNPRKSLTAEKSRCISATPQKKKSAPEGALSVRTDA